MSFVDFYIIKDSRCIFMLYLLLVAYLIINNTEKSTKNTKKPGNPGLVVI